MKSLAFVVSIDGKEDLKYDDVDLSKVISKLKESNVEVDIVAFDDDEVVWQKYELIIPTAAFRYIHQYEKLLKVWQC